MEPSATAFFRKDAFERKVLQFERFPRPTQLSVCRVGVFSASGSVAEKILLNQGPQNEWSADQGK
jgi:hypothetical protein